MLSIGVEGEEVIGISREEIQGLFRELSDAERQRPTMMRLAPEPK